MHFRYLKVFLLSIGWSFKNNEALLCKMRLKAMNFVLFLLIFKANFFLQDWFFGSKFVGRQHCRWWTLSSAYLISIIIMLLVLTVGSKRFSACLDILSQYTLNKNGQYAALLNTSLNWLWCYFPTKISAVCFQYKFYIIIMSFPSMFT